MYTTNTTVTATLLASLLMGVLAVNSPQMTFFTPPSHETVIHLESKYSNSATLKLSRQNVMRNVGHPGSVPSSEFNKTVNRKISEFVILGPDYPLHGVSAIIQQMNLRTTQHGCKDFIQFSANASRAGQSSPICGRISRNENWNEKNVTDPRLQRSYFNADGTIHLYFYSENWDDQDEEQDVGDDESHQEIGVEIVFSSYTACPNPANSWKKLKPCSNTEKMSCVYSTLFCDSKVDCGFPGEFGLDEEGCYIPYIYMSLSIFGGVFITTSLIYLFLKWVTKVPKEYQNYQR